MLRKLLDNIQFYLHSPQLLVVEISYVFQLTMATIFMGFAVIVVFIFMLIDWIFGHAKSS